MAYPSQATLHQLAEMNHCEFIPTPDCYYHSSAQNMPFFDDLNSGCCFALSELYIKSNGNIEKIKNLSEGEIQSVIRKQAIFTNGFNFLNSTKMLSTQSVKISSFQHFFQINSAPRFFPCNNKNEYLLQSAIQHASNYKGFSLLSFNGPKSHLTVIDNITHSTIQLYDSSLGIFRNSEGTLQSQVNRLAKIYHQLFYMFYFKKIYPANYLAVFWINKAIFNMELSAPALPLD